MTTIIAKTITKICVPLVILFSISLLFGGHNDPGGGFIAGTMFVAVIALMYVVFGLEYTTSFFDPDWNKWFAFGLMLSILTGFGAMIWGHNFLWSAFEYIHLPLSDVELASATIFDIGVYFVVIGTLLSIFKKVGEKK